MKKSTYLFLIFYSTFFLSCLENLDDSTIKDLENTPPSSFSLISIDDKAINVELIPSFNWKPSTDKEGKLITYTLILDENQTPTTPIVKGVKETNYTLDFKLDRSKTYFWKIIATDGERTTESKTFSFTTAIANFSVNPIVDAAQFSPRYRQTTLVFKDKIWIIGGSNQYAGDDSTFLNDVWSSDNGIDWTLINSNPDFSPREGHASVVFKDKMWVIGGKTATSGTDVTAKDIWYSEDGLNWTQATDNASFGGIAFHKLVVFKDKLWLIGGVNLDTDLSFSQRIYATEDGKTWSRVTENAPFGARTEFDAIVFKDELYIILGLESGSSDGEIWRSQDGVSWELISNDISLTGIQSHSAIAFDGFLFIYGGNTPDIGYVNDVWYSRDGEKWKSTPETQTFSFLPREWHSSLIFQNKIWLFAGQQKGEVKNDIWVIE